MGVDLARPADQDLYLTQLPSYEYRDLVIELTDCARRSWLPLCSRIRRIHIFPYITLAQLDPDRTPAAQVRLKRFCNSFTTSFAQWFPRSLCLIILNSHYVLSIVGNLKIKIRNKLNVIV